MKKQNTFNSFFLFLIAVALLFTTQTMCAQLRLMQDTSLNKIQTAPRKINIKQYILPGSAMFVSGFLDGTIEAIKFHYDSGFKPRFKNVDDQFWNPDVSWTNKYKNGNPDEGPKFRGSTNSLVCLTDAYHGLRTAKNLVNTLTLTFYINRGRKDLKKIKIKKILLDALILTTIRNVGFTASYSVLFKPQVIK